MSKKVFLDEDIINKIKNIQFKANHLVNSSFSGSYQSIFKGAGVEFDEVREYAIGDDVRRIDWNVTARSVCPYVKIFKDERELTLILMVDVSGSTKFGSNSNLKNEVAAQVAATLSYMALKNSDKVGLILFSGNVEHFIPPKKGKSHIWRIIKDILTYESKDHQTNIKQAFDYLNKVIKKKSIVFVISDFKLENIKDLTTSVAITSIKHDLNAIEIFDKREKQIPEIGLVQLEDLESGESLLVDSSDSSFRNFFEKKIEEDNQNLLSSFSKYGIDLIRIDTESSFVDSLLKYFKQKGKRKK